MPYHPESSGKVKRANKLIPAQTPPLAGNLPYLSLLRSLLCSHADSYHPAPTLMDPTVPKPAPLSLRDRVLLIQLAPKSLKPQWTEPYTMILTTVSGVKLLGHPCWYHLSRLKWAPLQDTWSIQQLGLSTL